MGSAKDEHGGRERFAKEIVLFANSGGLQEKESIEQPPYIYIAWGMKKLLWNGWAGTASFEVGLWNFGGHLGR